MEERWEYRNKAEEERGITKRKGDSVGTKKRNGGKRNGG